MRFFVLIILLFVFQLHVSALGVSVNSYLFYANEKPYIDVNIRILANTIKYRPLDNLTFQSSADVTMTIEDENSGVIVAWEKYKLVSPVLENKNDIVDQRRFFVGQGQYMLNIQIVDSQDSLNNFRMKQKIKVREKLMPSFSDIELITSIEKRDSGSMVRHGIYMEPFPFGIVNESQQLLHFYTEFYHTEEALLSYGVYTGVQPSDSSEAIMVKYKKVKKEDVTVILHTFNLNRLPSGDYHLKVAMIDDQKKELVSKFASFINMNFPADIALKRDFNKEYSHSFVSDMDSSAVRYSLMALAPQFNNQKAETLKMVLKEGSLSVQKYFLFNYYKQEYPAAPQLAYDKYMKVVDAINNQFYSTVGYGFQTDRGYIYLKYGRPSKTITIEDEAGTPPYEIWYYDYIPRTSQTNVRFIFYSPLLANEFDLLHSTCRGEKNASNWETVLYRSASGEQIGRGLDATSMQPNSNRKARKLFEDQ